jgi:hypothetical protein
METEKAEQLLENFEQARRELRQNACVDSKAVHRFEIQYGTAYQKLVKAGLMPKLRLKYRPLY